MKMQDVRLNLALALSAAQARAESAAPVLERGAQLLAEAEERVALVDVATRSGQSPGAKAALATVRGAMQRGRTVLHHAGAAISAVTRRVPVRVDVTVSPRR